MRKSTYIQLGLILATLVLALFVALVRLDVLGAPAIGAEVGDVPPAFSLPDLSGRVVHFTPKAHVPQVLNFFASWCGPCRAETPFLVQTAASLKGRVAFWGIDLTASEPDAASLKAFLRHYRVSYPVLLDTTGKVAVDYGVAEIPTTFVVSPDGRIVAVWRRRVPEVDFLATLRRLSGKS